MKKAHSKGRAVSGKGFGSPAPSGFGGFSTPSSGGRGLSYLSDPPDYSSISDANVVVSFKNLLKKDSTTKTKALEDLVAYVQAHPYDQDGGVEEPVLKAWVKIYPRLSIDNSRRVRELSHNLQLELMKSGRKRMSKHIPDVVGPWLAGTFDKDKVAARAASDGLASFLDSQEKLAQFWKKCQPQILDYATEALAETPDTLSDERSTNAEDAEAKYYRVIAGSLSLVLGLLQRLPPDDAERYDAEYEQYFSTDRTASVWSFAVAKDSLVRKLVYQLLWICMDRRPETVKAHLPRIGKTMISDALKMNQTGCTIDFVRVLTKLTQKHGDIWGSKKDPLARLRSFVEKGSQGSSASFWDYLDSLLESLPQDAVPYESASEFLQSFRTGITRREEPRSHAPQAWNCYLDTVSHFLKRLNSAESRTKFVAETLFPLTKQYLFPSEQSVWSAGGHLQIYSKAYAVASLSGYGEITETLSEEWIRLSSIFIERLANSLPEVSKEFESSQQKIAADSKRWFSVVGTIHTDLSKSKGQAESTKKDATEAASREVLSSAVDLLKRRNYKPFGSAMLLLSALSQVPHLFEGKDASLLSSVLPTESNDDMKTMLSSPSAPSLISCINAMALHFPGVYKSVWTASIHSLLNLGDKSTVNSSISKLISNASARSLALEDEALQEYLTSQCINTARNDGDAWALFEASLTWDVLTDSSLQKTTSEIVDKLGDDKSASLDGLRAIERLLLKKPTMFAKDEALHLVLITKLLGMMEITDVEDSAPGGSSVVTKAASLVQLLGRHVDGQPYVISIIQDNLERPGEDSLEIDTLVGQATAMSKSDGVVLEQLFPNTNIWMQELMRFLQDAPTPSLALTSNIGGAYFLPERSNGRMLCSSARRDAKGYSIPARMAVYSTQLLSTGVDFESIPTKFQAELLCLLYLVAELASDQITLTEDNKLWKTLKDAASVLADAEDFISSTRRIINGIVAKSGNWKPGCGTGLLDELVNILLQQSRTFDPKGLYSARALSEIFQVLSDANGLRPGDEDWITRLDVMKATPSTVFPAVALLTGYGETLASSKTVSNLLNRLVSDVAGASPQSDKTLLTLVLLNACLPIYEVGQLPVANNRLVFAVKQITSWFEQPWESIGSNIATESCRALQRLLPCVKEVYGPYWEKTIEFCIFMWTHAGHDTPHRANTYLYASFKLMSALDAIDEPNDDLVDALDTYAESRSTALLELLKLPTVDQSQPAEMVGALLCRQAEKIPLDHIKELSDIYGLVASDSRDIQTAGFGILHRALPAAQEKLSLDVLIEKKVALLPDELLSLLLDAPTMDAYPEDILVQFPTPIRSYLLSWKLVFDTYEAAAYKVRSDYTENLKTANGIGPLMDFVFDVLGHSAAHQFNLEKEGFTDENIRDYDVKLGDAEPDEKNMHWFLIHIFYLTLKHVPGLFKTWFIDCRSKQTKIAVQSWMTRYFSPLIVSDVLDEVEKWSKAQDVPDDDKELIVRVNRAGKEVFAAYEVDDDVDELQASIVIRIPPSYPLDSVNVIGINRVACNERKWQSWLMNTQGVITFSNGSIIDGLTTFRRNIVGALKGHSECAICYSYISADKKMPDKRCDTCKNLFHRHCLFKWFQSSNQNTCPLCRNPIGFMGAPRRGPRDGNMAGGF